MLWRRHGTRVWETWWDSQLRKRYTAQAVQCRAPQGSSFLCHVLGYRARTALHPRLAQAAAMQVHAEYSTGTCFLWSVRFVNFWGQGHACNTLISGATVQWSISLGCSRHSWNTVNPHSFPDFAEETFCPFDIVLAFIFCPTKLLTLRFLGNPCQREGLHLSSVVILLFPPLLHTLLSPCIVLLVTKQAAIYPLPFSAPGLLSSSLSQP